MERHLLQFSWIHIFGVLYVENINCKTSLIYPVSNVVIYLNHFQCTINIVFDRVGKKDPVTRGIEIAINWMGWNFDVNFWSQQVSFYLVGCIVVTSIRGFIITLTKVLIHQNMKTSNLIKTFRKYPSIYFKIIQIGADHCCDFNPSTTRTHKHF